jgi:hypothetical protein
VTPKMTSPMMAIAAPMSSRTYPDCERMREPQNARPLPATISAMSMTPSFLLSRLSGPKLLRGTRGTHSQPLTRR